MVLKEIQERYSVRKFQDKPVPDEVIKDILEAGRLAPSWANTQPWHFIVIKDAKNKPLLAQLANGQPHVENAPVIILCCGDKNAWERENLRKTVAAKQGITPERIELLLNNEAFNPTLKGEDFVTLRTMEELTYAVAYMTMEAHSGGVGCCVIGLLANDLTGSAPEVHQLARKTLNLPDNIRIMTMLILGYPEEAAEKPPKLRKSFDEVVSYEVFGG